MSVREPLPAVLALVLLVVVGVVVGVRLVDAEPTPSPLTAEALRLPLDGSCYVVAVPGRNLADPPVPPPADGQPQDALAAWTVRTLANPVGSSRTRVTVLARGAAVTVTSVEVSGSQALPMLQRDWRLDSRCRPGTMMPVARSASTPAVVLAGDLDGAADGRRVTLTPQPGGTLPLRVAAGTSARLVLDLRTEAVSMRWAATVHWTADDGRHGTTLVDGQPDTLNLISGARVTTHYGWDVEAGRWVQLPSSGTAG
ncbi:hypothetical protein GCM10009814_20550 [Lapillicoccus jejuensis]|uniref:Uncharacterized protein n=2 Tax=Lapillicoccus jejuensis TaxID=402171 RepID=A0A542E3J9_9MICO|nr:hypothetical protein FB458_3034 [Lapillicoccus jejuensis]